MDGEERTLKRVINTEERGEGDRKIVSVLDTTRCSLAMNFNGMNKKNIKWIFKVPITINATVCLLSLQYNFLNRIEMWCMQSQNFSWMMLDNNK